MRKTAVAVFSVLVLAAGLVHAAPAPKPASNSIVIVFKDGHRQVFKLADVERIEFEGAAASAIVPSEQNPPPRGRYLGKWAVGDGNGSTFYITLDDNGDAFRSLGDVHGHWAYVNGDAQITWDDGAQDAIRRTGSRYQKYAYSSGKSFTDNPDNVAPARNTSPRPI
jgi:hypothetical protein